MSIFSRGSESTLIAIFDITSSSVGGLLFERHPDKLPEIISVFRQPTDFLPKLEFQKFQRFLHKTFENVIFHLKKKMPKNKKKPDLAVIVFSSPYYVSQTKIIRSIHQKPFEITRKFLDHLVDEEADSMKKEWTGGYASKEQMIEILEKEAMGYKLNGYFTGDPFGKKAKTVELSVNISLGIKEIHDKLKDCINHSFGEMEILFKTFPVMAFKALKMALDISKGLLLVDIGGEVTELALINDDILKETASFPLGENFLIRRIASAFHFSLEESVSLLGQYARGDLHDDTREKVKKIIGEAGQKWCEFFNKSLEGFSDFSFLPQNRLIIGGKAAAALKDFIICTKEQPIQIEFLLPEAFKSHFVFRRGFGEDNDISLMLSALSANKLF